MYVSNGLPVHVKRIGDRLLSHGALEPPNLNHVSGAELSGVVSLSVLGSAVEKFVRLVFQSRRPAQVIWGDAAFAALTARVRGLM